MTKVLVCTAWQSLVFVGAQKVSPLISTLASINAMVECSPSQQHEKGTLHVAFNSRPAPGTPKQALPGGEGPPTYRFRVNNLPKICQVIDGISLGSPPFHINPFSPTAAYNSNSPISFLGKETLLVSFFNKLKKLNIMKALTLNNQQVL